MQNPIIKITGIDLGKTQFCVAPSSQTLLMGPVGSNYVETRACGNAIGSGIM
jgi:hypothetical protein